MGCRGCLVVPLHGPPCPGLAQGVRYTRRHLGTMPNASSSSHPTPRRGKLHPRRSGRGRPAAPGGTAAQGRPPWTQAARPPHCALQLASWSKVRARAGWPHWALLGHQPGASRPDVGTVTNASRGQCPSAAHPALTPAVEGREGGVPRAEVWGEPRAAWFLTSPAGGAGRLLVGIGDKDWAGH